MSVPTSSDYWRDYPPTYAAYAGGYAGSTSTKGISHKPGFNCVMESHEHFCAVCTQGILDVIHFGLGEELHVAL